MGNTSFNHFGRSLQANKLGINMNMLFVLFFSATVLGFGGWSEDVVFGGGERRDNDDGNCANAQGRRDNGDCTLKKAPNDPESCGMCRYGWKASGYGIDGVEYSCCGTANQGHAQCDCPKWQNGYRRYYAESGSLQQNAISSYAPRTIQEFVIHGFAFVGVCSLALAAFRRVCKKHGGEFQTIVDEEAT